MLDGESNGPSFALAQDSAGTIWLGTWNGLYQYQNGTVIKAAGPTGPISAICAKGNIVYAIGPNGFWKGDAKGFTLQKAAIARSVRDVISDGKDGLWIASDVGLYHWTPSDLIHTYKTDALIAAYTKGLAHNHDGKLWFGVFGGFTIKNYGKK